MALKSGVLLSEGETLVMEIEAELWALSSNPIARAFGDLARILSAIVGFKQKGFLVITNKRVVEVKEVINCWCITTGRTIKYVLPSSIKEVGYTRNATCGFFCPAYRLYYESFTQVTDILLKDADESEALRITDAFYNAIKGNK